jgi:predicted NBD/HSP70 family sugar kinase
VDELAARATDPVPGAALERAGRALGIALAATVNLLDVREVVLGGVHARLAPWLTGALQSELDRRVVSRELAPVRVHVSELGPYAAVRGAAGSVVSRVVADPLSVY